jgi:hypothetical protein
MLVWIHAMNGVAIELIPASIHIRLGCLTKYADEHWIYSLAPAFMPGVK